MGNNEGFSLHDFTLRNLLDAVGRQDDWKIRMNAAGYLDKGTLSEEDLKKIDRAIREKNATRNG